MIAVKPDRLSGKIGSGWDRRNRDGSPNCAAIKHAESSGYSNRLSPCKGTYHSLVRRTQYVLFTGRSSDSASSPRPLLDPRINGTWLRLRLTAAVLSEIRTPFPILSFRRPRIWNASHLRAFLVHVLGERAPVNTRVFCCNSSITSVVRLCKYILQSIFQHAR